MRTYYLPSPDRLYEQYEVNPELFYNRYAAAEGLVGPVESVELLRELIAAYKKKLMEQA